DKIDVEVSSNVMVWQKKNVNYADNWYMSPAQQVDMENDFYKWYYSDAPTAATNLTSTANALNGTGSFNMNITPIMYDHYLLKTGAITQAELDSRMAKYRTNNFAQEYADHILKNQVLQSHDIAVRNRTRNFQSNLVFNFKGDNGGNIHDNDKQLNVFYKGSYDMTKWMTINFSVNNILQRSEDRRSNYVENIFDPFGLPAYYSLFNDDGSYANISPGWTHYYNPYTSWVEDNPALQPMHYHILDELNKNKHRTERQNTRYHGELLFKIMDGLTINTQYVYEVNKQSVTNYSEEDSYVMRLMRNVYSIRNTNGTYRYLLPTTGGRLAFENRQGNHWTARAQLNFSRVIADLHEVDFLAGVEFRETNTKGTRGLYLGWDDQLQSHSTTAVNFNELWLINSTTSYAPGYPARQFVFSPFIESALTSSGITEVKRRNGSGYANFTYTYNRKYNAFASVRKDYADVYGLATEFRGSPFGSFGLSWNMHREDFMSRYNFVDNLKLRTSYGYTGNIYQGATSYMTATTGQINNYTTLPRASIESPGNPELSWERTGTFNVGLEFMLFNYRLRGVVDWYNKKSDKVFSNQTLESTTGFTSLVMNMANVANNGIELTLSYDWLRSKGKNGVSWTTSGTASWNRNRVTRVEIQATSAYQVVSLGYKQGYPVRSLFSYKFAGLTDDGSQAWYAEDGRIIPGVTIQSATPGSVYFTGQADPKHTFAMENQVGWKGFSLNVMMVYYGGHHMRANQVQINPGPGALPVRSWYLDAWTPSNKNTTIPGIWQYNTANATQPAVQNNTDIFVHRADFLKIRNLVLGYDLNKDLVSKIGLDNLSLRFQIDNLPAVWKSNDIGVDPETLGLRLPTCYVFGLNFRF
ncbi:MAG TPA: TonB-dependent receptor, partial [Parasegetibacter sp.]